MLPNYLKMIVSPFLFSQHKENMEMEELHICGARPKFLLVTLPVNRKIIRAKKEEKKKETSAREKKNKRLIPQLTWFEKYWNVFLMNRNIDLLDTWNQSKKLQLSIQKLNYRM